MACFSYWMAYSQSRMAWFWILESWEGAGASESLLLSLMSWTASFGMLQEKSENP